jgi:quercetin dioxygenase-like cupin family protein
MASHDLATDVVISGEREPYWVFGGGVVLDIKLDGTQTDDAYTLLEGTILPGGLGPLHRHMRDDELWILREGTLVATIGEETRTLGPGDVAWMPRGVAHGFVHEGTDPVRMTVLISPAGQESAVREMGVRKESDEPPDEAKQPPDMEQLGALAARYGLELLPPA